MTGIFNIPGISPATVAAAGLRHVTAVEARQLCGIEAAGLWIPYPGVIDGGKPYGRLRLDNPTAEQKYHQQTGTSQHGYLPPGIESSPTACDLFIIEGEKKALALSDAGFACVGVGGFFGFAYQDEPGEFELVPELTRLIQQTKPARILFVGDSDTALNAEFSRAAIRLAGLVACPVLLPRIPLTSPKGCDDCRAAMGDGFGGWWRGLVAAAIPVKRGTKREDLAATLFDDVKASFPQVEDQRTLKARLAKLHAAFADAPLFQTEIVEAAKTIGLAKADFVAASKAEAERKAKDFKKRQSKSAAAEPASDSKMWLLPSDDVPFIESARRIFGDIAPTHSLFVQGTQLVEVATVADEYGKRMAISPIDPEDFRSRLECYGFQLMAQGQEKGKTIYRPKRCSMDSAKTLMATKECRELLPPISLVTNAPIVVENESGGLEVLKRGYHPTNGGIMVLGGKAPEQIALGEAVLALEELIADFDFLTRGDRARALVAFLTPSLKVGGFIRGPIPVDVAEADSSQSGKTFRHKLVRAVYGEDTFQVALRDGGVGSLDEAISSAIGSGKIFVTLDNLRGRVASQFFESAITAGGPIEIRRPHRPSDLLSADKVNFQLSSNGAEMTRDLANRASIVRIRKRPSNFVFKTWPEGGVLEHVQANQPLYLGAVFVILRAWHTKGKPRTACPGHDFREWAGIGDWIAQNILQAGPLLEGHQTAQARVADPNLSWLRAAANEVMRTNPDGADLTASELADICDDAGIGVPGAQFKPDQAAQIVGRIMRRVFGDKVATTVEGIRVERHEKQEYDIQTRNTRNVKVYGFLRATTITNEPNQESLQPCDAY